MSLLIFKCSQPDAFKNAMDGFYSERSGLEPALIIGHRTYIFVTFL